MRLRLAIMALAGLAAGQAMAQTPARPDPILTSPQPGPCAEALESPDYVPGLDAAGQAVDRADIGAQRVPLPDSVVVPLASRRGGRGGRAGRQDPPYVALDGQRLAPLLNPPPPCRPGRG